MLRVALLFAAAALIVEAQTARSLGDLTGNWWLALDNRIWQSRGTAELRFHAFEKYSGNPVLRGDQPWEGNMAYLYGTVLPSEDGRTLRMWYHAHVSDPSLLASKHRYTNLYATSTDGFHWTKPNLGLYEFQGSRINNIFVVHPGAPGDSHSPNVIHTPWETDPARRYKLVTYVYYGGYHGATSPDGLAWKHDANTLIFKDGGDVGNFVWDPNRKSYIGYPKVFDTIRGYRRRSVGFTETRDFENWPTPRLILAPDEEDDRGMFAPEAHTDFYGLSAFPYQNIYVGFLWIYRLEKGDERIWPELVFSSNGVDWNRVPSPRSAVLPLGAQGTWDDGMIFTSNQPLIRNGRLQLYYGGFDGPHNARNRAGAIGLASLRRDGFASLYVGNAETSVSTVPLTGQSEALTINADALAGEVRAEVLDASGKVLPGYERVNCTPFRGNSTDHRVKWKDRSELPAGTLQVRFWMRNASLYSFFAGEGAVPLKTVTQGQSGK